MTRFPATWVLVADSARARLFSWHEAPGPLAEIEGLANPEGRMKDADLASDRPGVTYSSRGHSSGHRMQAATVSESAAEVFARTLASLLKRGLDGKQCQRLVLVAPPAFLGILRRHLDKRTAQAVAASLDNDLSLASAEEILKRLPRLTSLG